MNLYTVMDSGVVDTSVDVNQVIGYQIRYEGPTWERFSNEPLRINTTSTSSVTGSDVS